MPRTHPVAAAFGLAGLAFAFAMAQDAGVPSSTSRIALLRQPRTVADAGSRGCLSCHVGIEPMHASPAVQLSCVDCHRGDAAAGAPPGAGPASAEYLAAKDRAHVRPRFPERWPSAANPERSYTLTLEESPEWIRFVNPGDLRVARKTCGPCHLDQVNRVTKSPMTTSSIFWGAAAYANGILGQKISFLGESYGVDGKPQKIEPKGTTEAERARGALPVLFPLPRWEITQPGEYFRAFERGGLLQPSSFPDLGNPNREEDAGRPDIRLSSRGRGTGLRISPGVLNLHKTRLNDPHLSFLGTNDHAGDYRSSGCTACHTIYANDREPLHSGPYAKFGNRGATASADPTIPRGEPGHPIRHQFSRAVPTSQCMSCHMHQPNSFVNTYLGTTMWDYETDGELLWPKEQRYPSEAEKRASLERNPEGAATRGLWGDLPFLAKVSELNPQAQHTQFADYHGHGWVFRAVYKQDRKGHLLDAEGRIVPFEDPERFQKAVHLRDIHLEKGMHCADCHFSQDAHGDGLLHGEYGDSIEIGCEDCHGTVRARSTLRTSGPAAPSAPSGATAAGTGTDLSLAFTPDGRRRFTWRGGRLYQRSMLDSGLEWEVRQVLDSITPGDPRYNERARLAKTIQRDGSTWGLVPPDPSRLAHSDGAMTCYSCHSSWMTSCFGCHLPQEANQISPMRHFEGTETRNFASYNPQVIRTDVYMLGKNGNVKGNKIAPIRSSSALVLSSVNLNRQRFYLQQPPISAPGFSSQAFNPHVPHTVRTTETKGCTDCHLSKAGDNEAWMTQLLALGTGFVNFVGRFAWVGEQEGLEAVAVTEWDEPQAVLGSFLHRIAYPDFFRAHEKRGLELPEAYEHSAAGEVASLQLRGEYLYAAEGKGGLAVYDVANVDNKDFSERLVTAPVSPLGQRIRVRTRDAAAVALPTNMPVAPGRRGDPANQEQPIHPIYRYAFVADRQEGLVAIDVATLTDGNPENNFLKRAWAFDFGGALRGAEGLAVAGDLLYVVGKNGLAVVDCSDPQTPRLVARLPEVSGRSVAVQFRYLYVAGPEGLDVIDITFPERPRVAARLAEVGPAGNVYLARTYAYLAAGARGIAIVDIERPERPTLDRFYDAGGRLSDVRDVKIGSTGPSLFAYVANGKEGFAVVQLTSPEATPGYLGFSPRPEPKLIAVKKTHHPALALSRGLDRDRAVDESGHQVSVMNRLGARPFNREEMGRLYLRNGEVYRVGDDPPGPPGPPSGEKEKR